MFITYRIDAIPRPQGSKRHVGGGIMLESSKHVANWRAFARLCAVQAMQGREIAAKGTPVRLVVRFRFDRPQKHYNSKGLKSDAAMFHVSKPDSDKLLRALLDSMSGVVFYDDSQVCELSIDKCYDKSAHTQVEVKW
jgi:crossover junction endodeoxyribonuclease RusA